MYSINVNPEGGGTGKGWGFDVLDYPKGEHFDILQYVYTVVTFAQGNFDT
jgi:hypothetical protein